MEQVWNRNHKEIVGDTSLQILKMLRAPGIQIYRVTALPTARELELDSLSCHFQPKSFKDSVILSLTSNSGSCLLRYSLIVSSFTKCTYAFNRYFPPISGTSDSKKPSPTNRQ